MPTVPPLDARSLGDRIRAEVAARQRTIFERVGLPAAPGEPVARPAMPSDVWRPSVPQAPGSTLTLPGRPAPVQPPVAGPATRPPATPAAPTAPPPAQAPAGGGFDAFVAAIEADPMIQQAFDSWSTLSTEEKLAVGERISQLQGAAFGFTPVTGLRRDPNLAQPGQSGVAGHWSSANGITISDLALADPAAFLNVVVHEQAHEMEWQQGKHDSHHADGDAVYELGDDVQRAVFGTVMGH